MRRLSDIKSKDPNQFAVCLHCKEIFIDDLHGPSCYCPNGCCGSNGIPMLMMRANSKAHASYLLAEWGSSVKPVEPPDKFLKEGQGVRC